MQKKFLTMLALSVAVALFADGGKPKQPEWKGKSGPRVLLFNGGRPWQGDGVSSTISGAGFRVRNYNSVYLDGFGGATIKAHVTDKKEPQAFDGFTPAFKTLASAPPKLLVFHYIPEKNYEKIFTPERIAQLKAYLENGGNLLVTRSFPAGIIDELLPVALGDIAPISDDEAFFANRPKSETFACIPEKFPVYGSYRESVAKPEAEVLSMIQDEKGNPISPFVSRINIGKGTVTYFNVEMAMPRQIRAYENWAYHTAFFIAVVGDSAQTKVKPEKYIAKLEAIPARQEIGETSASLIAPKLGITDESGAIQVNGNQVVFANGMKLDVASDGSVSVTWPGKDKAAIKKYELPKIGYSKKQKVFDSATAEAVDVKEDLHAADIKWHFDGITVKGNEAVLTYATQDSEMQWFFKAGKFDLDGRTFAGIGNRVEVKKCPLLISSVQFSLDLDLDDPLYAHRNDCYQSPRGYTAFDMTGKTKGDTLHYGGQPFEMIACKDALYIAHRSHYESTGMHIFRDKGAATITTKHGVGFGRVKAPVATHYYWHWLGDGAERSHNDYLAMYQYMRHLLRTEAGLKELPGYPIAEYGYQLKPEEKEFVIQSAAKAGYRFIYPPNPESPIDKIADDNNMAVYETIAENGAKSHIWTAGSYVQGNGGWIINNHPEWFVRDEKGKILQYFSKYPVIDVNNPAFYDWYVTVLKKAIDGGVGWVYRDMDGAAGGVVNYALDESPSGVKSQIKFYKFFHDNNCRVGIEGQNALVIDEYWYRADLYTSFAGKEFVLVGSMPGCDLKGGLTLDVFRTGMYACFPAFEVSGTAFGLDRIPGEVERGRRVFSFVPKFNEALDLVGMPYIRETEFGTVWMSDKGGALFFWNPAKKVTVELPANWKIRGVNGNVLTDVKADSIILVDKQ